MPDTFENVGMCVYVVSIGVYFCGNVSKWEGGKCVWISEKVSVCVSMCGYAGIHVFICLYTPFIISFA